ncbi:DUF4340 domain-containing protein [Chloroflexota bacterium]
MRLRNILILLVILLALGGYFYVSSRPEPAPPKEPRIYVWMVDMDKIKHIEIELPSDGKSQAFIKIKEGDKFPWYFDDPQRSNVDVERWGGGIPLLLSGPGVDRVISENTTEDKLAEFGLTQPQMKITLILEDGGILNIKVGDAAPDGHAYYVQAPDSNDVALVDYTWYEVLERLLTEPPYATSEED